ncbi:MAG TPA: c-type cytochrome [Ktedonobacterales bacterium]|jgi:plastocyanin/mono/diheme cytochrome c family protein
MGSNFRNPGLIAVTIGVALAVLFTAAGVTGVLDTRLGLGLAAVCLTAAALMYVFYSRANAVTRTGYGSLLMVIAVGLIIPLLTVNQQQQQVSASNQLYDQRLQDGAALFGQYCATCHGFLGQGAQGPKLNNNAVVNKLTDEDLTRIISGGIAGNGDPTKLAMPAWLDTYGGSLTEEDISYLVALIHSSNPDYIKTNGLEKVNGFNYVFGTLTNATQIAEYKDQKANLGKPTRPDIGLFKDLTAQTKVTVPIEDTPAADNAIYNFSPRYIIIKAGTTVTWVNQSSAPHTVVPTVANQFTASGILQNGSTSNTYTYTFAKAGDYPYYCSIHPAMTAWIIVQ